MNGRAIAILTAGTAGLVLIAASLLMPADKRFLAIASGLCCATAGGVIATCWKKPSQTVSEAVERVRSALVASAEEEIHRRIQAPDWALNAVDISSEEVSAPPPQPTHLGVSELVSESTQPVSESEEESLFSFDLGSELDPWESLTH
jgi:hypothetical protein